MDARRKLEKLMRELLEIGAVLPGSMSQVYKVCGKKGCKCGAPVLPEKHGPYNLLSYSLAGKDSTMFVKADDYQEIKEMQAKYVEFKTLCQNLPLAYIELIRAEGVAEANEFGKILGKICDSGNNLNERRLLYRIQELEKALLRWRGKATERTKIINGLKARVRQLDKSRDDWKTRAGEAEPACLLDKQVSVKKTKQR